MRLPALHINTKDISSNSPLESFRIGEQDQIAQNQRSLLKRVGGFAADGNMGEAANAALRGGDVKTGMGIRDHTFNRKNKLEKMSQDKRLKAFEMISSGVQRADTPEKYQALVGVISKTFGPEMVAGFETWDKRPSALTAMQKASLSLRQQAEGRSAEIHDLKMQKARRDLEPDPLLAEIIGMMGGKQSPGGQQATALPNSGAGVPSAGNALSSPIAGQSPLTPGAQTQRISATPAAPMAQASSPSLFDGMDPLEKQRLELALRHKKLNGVADMVNPPKSKRLQDYNEVKKQGYKGTFMDYQLDLKKAGAQREQIEYDKTIGGGLAKEFMNAMEVSQKGHRDLSQLRVMEQSMQSPDVYLGTGGNAIHGIKKTASTLFGLDVKGVADGEVIEKTTNLIALSLKDNLPGPLSNSDRDFLVALPAGLTSTPEGARRVVSLGIAHKQWQIERSAVARSYAANNGGRLDPGYYSAVAETDAKWDRNISGMIKKLRSQPQAEKRAPTAGLPAGSYSWSSKGLKEAK